MIMTEMEMATVYRQAKDKKKQIKILMELNGLRESEVRDILFRNGIKQNEMPRNRSHKQEEMDRLVAESVPEELSASEPESLPVFTPPLPRFPHPFWILWNGRKRRSRKNTPISAKGSRA